MALQRSVFLRLMTMHEMNWDDEAELPDLSGLPGRGGVGLPLDAQAASDEQSLAYLEAVCGRVSPEGFLLLDSSETDYFASTPVGRRWVRVISGGGGIGRLTEFARRQLGL